MGSVEALHQPGHVVSEEALAVHEAHVGVAAAVQHVRCIAQQEPQPLSCRRAQLCIPQQRQHLWAEVLSGPGPPWPLHPSPARPPQPLTLSVRWELSGW